MNESNSSTSSTPGAPTRDERTWGMIAHLSGFAGLIFPLGGVLAPLLIWLARRDRSAFVATEAKEALNFNITVVLGWIVCWVLAQIYIGVLFAVALLIAWIAMSLIAGLRASEGVTYRYPFCLRLVK